MGNAATGASASGATSAPAGTGNEGSELEQILELPVHEGPFIVCKSVHDIAVVMLRVNDGVVPVQATARVARDLGIIKVRGEPNKHSKNLWTDTYKFLIRDTSLKHSGRGTGSFVAAGAAGPSALALTAA